jgi:predicted alpha-1,6-mannanase (GH76 family)
MKPFYLRIILLVFFFVNVGVSLAQKAGIASGAIYSLKSKLNNKLLEVSNASLENGANVDCWTDTKSDAQRWIVTDIGKGVYTLTSVLSGKLLHVVAAPADSVNVDQADNTNGNDIKWTIMKAGMGSWYLKSVTSPDFSLNLRAGDSADGTNINSSRPSTENNQKWIFQKEAPQATTPAIAIADKMFEAWYSQYKVETGKGFWDRAEMMEIILDAYEVTKEAKYITYFDAMYKNFIADNKSDWMYNKYNDDITWAVLFCVRGYLLTGNKTYLEQGKNQFDKMYARAFTNSFGGGLIWYETKTSKNACINGPAMVASCYLAQATGDSTYYDKAIALYSWSKIYLFNPATGKVNDNVDFNKSGQIKISNWNSTYNQGTYLGAAVMLYNFTKEKSYLEEAEKIAEYTRDSMYNSKVIDNEDRGNDLPGFKGIFVRYARKYAVEGEKPDLNAWLLLNAKVAYNNRNSQDIIHTKWGTRTSEMKPKSAFGSSTAVSLLMNTLFLQH